MLEALNRSSRRCFVVLVLTSVAPLAAGVSVTGTVLGPSSQPLAGARLELIPLAGNFEAGRLRLAGQRQPDPIAEGMSDSAGRFLLRASAAGVFKVVASGEGRLPMQYSPVLLVEDEELPPVSLPIAAGSPVLVQDAEGRPRTGVWVFAQSSVDRESRVRAAAVWRPDFRIGRTGADGLISLPRLPGERLDVSVFPPGEAGWRKLDFEAGPILVPAGRGSAHRLRVVSPRGEPVVGVLIRTGDLAWPQGLTGAEGRFLVPCLSGETTKILLVAPDGRQQEANLPAACAGAGTTVVLADPLLVPGRILEEGGRSLQGALISTSLDPGAFLFTDAEGRYQLVAPDPQGFQLHARSALHLPRVARVTSAHLRAAGRAPTLALARAAALRGLVVDSRGAPLPGATVLGFLETGEGTGLVAAQVRTATDGVGGFALRPLQADGLYKVQAVQPGYLPASVEVVARTQPYGAAPLKIVLAPARSARGRVQDTEGRPIAGAEVRLSPESSPGAPRPEEPGEIGQENSGFLAHTDAQGLFRIGHVPAERVELTASRPGYATARARGMRIPPGVEPADLGVIVLKPGARLEGRVVSSSGSAVTGAEIHLVDTIDRLERQSARLSGEAPEAITRSDGSFALTDLPRDTPLHLLIRASGHLPAGVRGVRVPAGKPLVVRLEPGAALRGRILDEQQAPVAGARVDLTWRPSAPEDPERQTGAPVERSGVSSRDGYFEIRDAPAGPARLAVAARGYVALEGFETTVPWPDPDRELTITLSRGAVLTGRISTTAGRPVSGVHVSAAGAGSVSDDEGAYTVEGVPTGETLVEVLHPAYRRLRRALVVKPGINLLDIALAEGVEVTGRVTDTRKAPVGGATVALLRHAGGDWREYRERTREDGTFRFFPVAQGRYRLEAGGAGYATRALESPVIVAEDSLDSLEIVLEPGGSIAGRILGLGSDELAQVAVEATAGMEPIPATVDADGRYEIRHLPPGDYLVRAVLAAGQRHAQARVPLPANSEVVRDLEFTPHLTLSGQVLYGEEPLVEAKISIRGHQLAVERSVVTDYQGTFRFENLEPDTYWLGLSHARELLVHNEELEMVADLDHLIQLRPATVSGTVTDGESGRPVAGTLIILRQREGAEFVITDSARQDGTFNIHRIPAGQFRLTARAAGYAPAEQDLAVLAGQDIAGLEMALTPTQGIELTVTLASGRTPDQVHVRALGSGGAVILAETRLADRNGRIVLSTVPEGQWTLLLGAPGGAMAIAPVTVPGDLLSVTLREAGQVRIQVPALAATDLRAIATLSAAEHPLQTIVRGGTLQDRWSLVGGKAVVEGVPAGRWQVRVETPDGRAWAGTVTTPGLGEVGIVLE